MTEVVEIKEKKHRKYKKTVYGSTPYAFRFSGKTEDAFRKELDSWISEMRLADNELSASQALREIMKNVLRHFSEVPLDAPVTPQIDVETLKQGIIDDLKGWLAEQFATPEKAAHLATVSKRAADGESIDSDVIDNILEDFGR